MKLLIFVLNQEEHLEEVLELLVELGIRGATVIDSVGMGRLLSHNIPIFAGFSSMMQENRPFNKTIFTVIEDDDLDDIVKGISTIVGSLEGPGTGILMTVPLDSVIGLAKGF
jgi:nitrogen regulatory protein P-II 1